MNCNGELSDPLCNSVNRGLTLVRLLCLCSFFQVLQLDTVDVKNEKISSFRKAIEPEELFVYSYYM